MVATSAIITKQRARSARPLFHLLTPADHLEIVANAWLLDGAAKLADLHEIWANHDRVNPEVPEPDFDVRCRICASERVVRVRRRDATFYCSKCSLFRHDERPSRYYWLLPKMVDTLPYKKLVSLGLKRSVGVSEVKNNSQPGAGAYPRFYSDCIWTWWWEPTAREPRKPLVIAEESPLTDDVKKLLNIQGDTDEDKHPRFLRRFTPMAPVGPPEEHEPLPLYLRLFKINLLDAKPIHPAQPRKAIWDCNWILCPPKNVGEPFQRYAHSRNDVFKRNMPATRELDDFDPQDFSEQVDTREQVHASGPVHIRDAQTTAHLGLTDGQKQKLAEYEDAYTAETGEEMSSIDYRNLAEELFGSIGFDVPVPEIPVDAQPSTAFEGAIELPRLAQVVPEQKCEHGVWHGDVYCCWCFPQIVDAKDLPKIKRVIPRTKGWKKLGLHVRCPHLYPDCLHDRKTWWRDPGDLGDLLRTDRQPPEWEAKLRQAFKDANGFCSVCGTLVTYAEQGICQQCAQLVLKTSFVQHFGAGILELTYETQIRKERPNRSTNRMGFIAAIKNPVRLRLLIAYQFPLAFVPGSKDQERAWGRLRVLESYYFQHRHAALIAAAEKTGTDAMRKKIGRWTEELMVTLARAKGEVKLSPIARALREEATRALAG